MVLRISLAVFAALAMLLWGASYWLLATDPVPLQSGYELDLERLRALAGDEGLPLRINDELVSERNLPAAIVFGGAPLGELHPMVDRVFQIVTPRGDVVVDAGLPPEMHASIDIGGEGVHHADAWARVKRALAKAQRIVLTHEHPDHIAGLASAADPEALKGALRWNRAQQANRTQLDRAAIPELLRRAEALELAEPQQLVPGVVLVPAPGHTPGSQLVYVRLQDGRELLLVGDVAWHMEMVRELRYRPRLTTQLLIGEDRAAVMAQLRTLHELDAAGQVRVVASHDGAQREALVREGWLGERFEGV